MNCLITPVSALRRRRSASRHGYLPLSGGIMPDSDDHAVTVVVGKEKREFLVQPFVLEERPFRALMEMVKREENKGMVSVNRERRVVLGDVDEILFEHMLWLVYNDFSSLFKLNLKEIIDFYAQDN